ncbi:MAG TPA: DUF4142 domain-containing protein [Vicinamibacterales bacterium]|nr:DUF4142 domain-containing protein [Vicinamibacterales bacterium]
MQKTWYSLLTIAVVAAIGCAEPGERGREQMPAGAERTGPEGTAGREGAGVTREARDFIEAAVADGLAEVELGRLAQERASDPEVKTFAERMIRDHRRAHDQLARLAAQLNVPAPPALEEDQRDLVDRLSKLKGGEFDREYIEAMIDDHEKAVDRFEEMAKADGPPELVSFASSTLPTLREHLQEAERIQQRLERRRAS